MTEGKLKKMPKICKIFLYIENQILVMKLFIKKMPRICKIFLYIENQILGIKLIIYILGKNKNDLKRY
jgi:hypothetical protein